VTHPLIIDSPVFPRKFYATLLEFQDRFFLSLFIEDVATLTFGLNLCVGTWRIGTGFGSVGNRMTQGSKDLIANDRVLEKSFARNLT
jgi:hypothetical protein